MKRISRSRDLYNRFRKAYAEKQLRELDRELSNEELEDESSTNGNADTAERPDDEKIVKRAKRRDYLSQYVRWLWRYWPTAIMLIVLSLSAAVLEMTHPLFLRYILDEVLLDDTIARQRRWTMLNLAGIGFLAIILFGELLNVYKNYRTRQLNVRVMLSLRRSLFERMIHLPLSKLTEMKTGGIISRLTGDVDSTSGLLQMGIVSPGVSLMRLVIALGMLFYLNAQLALISLTILPVAMGISFWVARRIRPIYRSIRSDASRVDARVGEAFAGVRTIRGFQQEPFEERYHAIGRHSIVRKQLFAHRRELALWTIWGFMLSSINLVAVWFGGKLYLDGSASIGDIMAFQWYALLLLNPVWQIVNSFSELQRSLAAMERVFEVLGMARDKPDRPDAREAPVVVHELRFENVDFHYNPGAPVLKNVNLVVPGGSTVAFVGRSGAGKTTATDLVARFYDPVDGAIRINGKDLREIQLASYRRMLGIVQQEVFLFDGSIRENIAYGRPDASDQDIVDAAERANAAEFIANLKNGYDTLIGERGVRLSGGQAQRLSIARAILADPQILILDEATSNLDTESEQLIQQSIAQLLVGRTTFVIAHRLSTVAKADLIVVLENGEIAEQGTHSSLMEAGGLYAQMVTRQNDSIQGSLFGSS